jgi:UDP-N-acetylglucosamine diphosphorylase / glucose-1-phosphate thymidylyltransferase / UDP-N-acetylgalactosamine diphosphorylase / glucosamine-1-phosphate N-acetyltransferase / galactosamine-1-phosphate N-acetyltransferase
MKTVVFEDEFVEQLHPITLARPSYAISCGSFRLVDWIQQLPGPKFGAVRDYLAEIQRIDFPELNGEPPAATDDVLYINARIVPSWSNFRILSQLAQAEENHVLRSDEQIAAVRIGAGGPTPPHHDRSSISEFLHANSFAEMLPLDGHLELLHYPHDVIHANQQSLAENLEFRLQQGGFREMADGLFLAQGAELGEPVVANSQSGPILLDHHARVGPFSYLSGPAYIGPNSRLIEHAAIKDAVSISHTVKIGGEVEASVIEPYTNKQHYGFLGHSYLGSWINLGAGTCNSDLKNTYGTINMDYGSGRVATGRQFVGCIMGDYAKSAIIRGSSLGKRLASVACCTGS